MQNILIFGASGQIGRFLTQHVCEKYSHQFNVIGVGSKAAPNFSHSNFQFKLGDIQYPSCIDRIVQEAKPRFIFNFAAISSPAKCEKQNREAYQVNVEGVWNILEGIKNFAPLCTFINAGSINEINSDKFSFYSCTKRMARALMETYSNQYEIKCEQPYITLNDSEYRREGLTYKILKHIKNFGQNLKHGGYFHCMDIYGLDESGSRYWSHSKDMAATIGDYYLSGGHKFSSTPCFIGQLKTYRELVEVGMDGADIRGVRKNGNQYLVFDGKREYPIFNTTNTKCHSDKTVDLQHMIPVKVEGTPFWQMVYKIIDAI